jgi:hypothetical protein
MPDEKRSIPQTVREAWLALTGAITTAEGELHKRFYESLGVAPDANLAQELMTRVRKNREEFERRIDEGVKVAVARVRAPIDKEIAALKQRIDDLHSKIEERARRRKQPKE